MVTLALYKLCAFIMQCSKNDYTTIIAVTNITRKCCYYHLCAINYSNKGHLAYIVSLSKKTQSENSEPPPHLPSEYYELRMLGSPKIRQIHLALSQLFIYLSSNFSCQYFAIDAPWGGGDLTLCKRKILQLLRYRSSSHDCGKTDVQHQLRLLC